MEKNPNSSRLPCNPSVLAELREMCANLERRVTCQKVQIERLHHDLEALERRTLERPQSSDNVGAILGSILWSMSDEYLEAAKMIVMSGRADSFFRIAREVLHSFVQKYKHAMPDRRSDLAQFPLSLCGCVVNMTSSEEGRKKIIEDPCCKEFIDTILIVLPEIPPKSGDQLIVMLLLILSNLSGKEGFTLKNKSSLLRVLVATVKRRNHEVNNLLPVALRMVESITEDIETVEEYNSLGKAIQAEDVEFWSRAKIPKIRTSAYNIALNLTIARDRFENISGDSYNTMASTSHDSN